MIEMREYLKSRGFTGHPFNTFLMQIVKRILVNS